jgi:Ca2+ transporting ATPase
VYEKVGEATEVALKVLSEKLNVQGLERTSLSPSQKATACLKSVETEYKKV